MEFTIISLDADIIKSNSSYGRWVVYGMIDTGKTITSHIFYFWKKTDAKSFLKKNKAVVI